MYTYAITSASSHTRYIQYVTSTLSNINLQRVPIRAESSFGYKNLMQFGLFLYSFINNMSYQLRFKMHIQLSMYKY